MSRWMKLLNFFLGGLLLVLVMYGIETSRADGNPHNVDVRQSNDMNNQTAGDIVTGGVDNQISTGGNKSYVVVPPGLGDVDIAQCLGSQAWTLLIGGKQTLVLNQVCMAEFYLTQGRYDLAAQALCNQPEILAEYTTEIACEIDHDFTPAIVEGEDEYDHDIHSRSNEFAEAYAMQEEEIEYLQEENASIVGRLDDLTALLEQAPAPVYVPQAPEFKYTDEDVAYILGLYDDGETEDE